MDSNGEIEHDSVYFRVYKSGHVERLLLTEFAPTSVDPSTGVSSKDLVIAPEIGVSVRLYLPSIMHDRCKKLPVLVYYHGGGFCMSSAFHPALHSYLNSLAAGANVIAVSVDYRLAPEHPIPAAYDDSWLALQWVASHLSHGRPASEAWLAGYADFNRVFVAGESAGANIAHHMAMRAGAGGLDCQMKLRGAVLIHPYFLGTGRVDSEAIDPEMSAQLESLWKVLVCPSTAGNDDPFINPMAEGAPSLAGLGCKRVLVFVAEKDVLRDRGRAYYQKLKESGWKGETEFFESAGEGHSFFLFKPSCEEAMAQDKAISGFINGE